MKANKSIVMILLAIIFLGFLFYWYEYRPSQIRKGCWGRIEDIKSGKIKSDKFVSEEFEVKIGNEQVINYLYNNCLKEQGLEK